MLICLTLSMAWVTIAAVYLYPDVKEEFEQHRYLRRIGKLHTPVIPIECPRARGIENQDFIREDKNPNGCWVDLASFRRNYPEIAEATDVAATILANLREEPPLPERTLPFIKNDGLTNQARSVHPSPPSNLPKTNNRLRTGTVRRLVPS